MAQGKKTFIFYADWDKLINAMPSEKAGELVKLMLAYVNDHQPEEPTDPFVLMAWAHIKPMLKKDLQQWSDKKQKFSDMGKKSAAKRNASQPTLTHVEHTLTVNDNVNVNVNDTVNDNVNDKEKKRIKKDAGVTAFNFWWDAYDKKVDRKKCLKKFLTLSDEEMRQCYQHTKLYVKASPDPQFRRNPITYLNNENWKEEQLTKPRAAGQQSAVSKAQQFRDIVDNL